MPCRIVSSAQALLSRETLLSTLARLLREDGPRSLDMAMAVAGCFYACSCVKELHRQLLDNQVRAAVVVREAEPLSFILPQPQAAVANTLWADTHCSCHSMPR